MQSHSCLSVITSYTMTQVSDAMAGMGPSPGRLGLETCLMSRLGIGIGYFDLESRAYFRTFSAAKWKRKSAQLQPVNLSIITDVANESFTLIVSRLVWQPCGRGTVCILANGVFSFRLKARFSVTILSFRQWSLLASIHGQWLVIYWSPDVVYEGDNFVSRKKCARYEGQN